MIFAAGLFIFVMAALCSVDHRPNFPAGWTAAFGLTGILLMLVSVCIFVARWMP